MYKKLTLFLLLITGFLSASATYVPITISGGLNADIVANGTGAANTVTTHPVDNDPNEYAFMTLGYNNGLVSSTQGLPVSGIINSIATPGLSFQLADYSLSNALQINTTLGSGTLTFSTPMAAAELYLLGVTGNGPGTVEVTVNFLSGSPQVFSGVVVPDWYNVTPFAMQGLGRVARVTNNIDNNTTNPRVYEIKLNILPANYGNLITSVTVTRTSATGRVNILAASINTPCVIPPDQGSALILSPGSSQIAGSFNGAPSNPTGYLVVRYPSAASPVGPVNGTSYVMGSTLGSGTVVYNGANTNFTSSGLFAATSYSFYIYSYNNTACGGGPLYNLTNPLFGTQTTTPCGGPSNVTIPIGPSQVYTSITDAITSITNTGLSGPVVLELQSNYSGLSEPAFPIVFPYNPCVSNVNTLTIRPAASASGLTIVSSNAGPTFDFNGASNIIIDGRPGGVGGMNLLTNLKIVNDNNAGSAIRFINDASSNTIKFCDLQGQNSSYTTSTLSGVVYFSTAGTANVLGNDNNSIISCDIHSTSTGTPAIGIVSYGSNSTPAAYNDNCLIDNCNIYDYYQVGLQSAGIKLDQGNSAWTVSNNSLYQTVPRIYTTSVSHRGMHINSNSTGSASMTPQGSGFNIIGNYIGGSSPFAGGTAMDLSGGTLTHNYMGMDVSVGVGAPTIVKNNVFRNITFSTANVNATTPNFVCIHGNYGNLNINNNTIGDSSLASAITLTRTGTSVTAGLFAGIRIAGGITNIVDSNVIAGITTIGSATVPYSIVGIYVTNGTTNTIANNIVGTYTIPNSLNASTAGGTQLVYGVWVTAGTTNIINGNTISNLNNSGTSTAARVIGINFTASAPSISNNIIRNFTAATTNTGTDGSAAVIGLSLTSTTAPFTISGNRIYDLLTTSTSVASSLIGIYVSAATSGVNSISKNFIYRLASLSTSTSSIVSGIVVNGGTATYANNMIALGFDAQNISIPEAIVLRGITKNGTAANNFYFNSVYIGGTVFASGSSRTFAFQRNNTSGTDAIKNNIFMNARTNGGSSSSHYAINFGSNTGTGGNVTGVDLNYNVYHVSGTGGVMGFTTTDVLSYTSGWVASDLNSVSADPQFINPAAVGGGGGVPDLHINGSIATPVESAGTPIASIADDFDADIRANVTPTDIGADAANFLNAPLSVKLLSFSGENIGKVNLLNWKTLAETVGDVFELERSVDSNSFLHLDKFEAYGAASTYSYNDRSPGKGVNHYRLKMMDLSGKVALSNVVTLHARETSSFSIKAYPNPVTDQIMVSTFDRAANAGLTLTDVRGVLIRSIIVNAESEIINMSDLATGIYYIKYTDNSRSQTLKITKE